MKGILFFTNCKSNFDEYLIINKTIHSFIDFVIPIKQTNGINLISYIRLWILTSYDKKSRSSTYQKNKIKNQGALEIITFLNLFLLIGCWLLVCICIIHYSRNSYVLQCFLTVRKQNLFVFYHKNIYFGTIYAYSFFSELIILQAENKDPCICYYANCTCGGVGIWAVRSLWNEGTTVDTFKSKAFVLQQNFQLLKSKGQHWLFTHRNTSGSKMFN